MPIVQSKFVWYDAMTSDCKAAESFYSNVIGWKAEDSGMPDRSYTILSVGPTMVGGLMPFTEEARASGARPCWTGYIGVDDVDDYTARVQAAGGSVHRQPEDIPDVGRFAVVADPYGAVFILFKSNSDQQPEPVASGTPGHIGWHELYAGDGESAFAFYSGLFGWTKAEAIDMGEMGIYQTFAAGDEAIGGMMTKMPDTPMPFWLYYFNVDALDAAVERVTKNGGQVLMGPHQVPGDLWIAQCTDPQGAMFALLSAKR
jgi:uncharacterized protein